MPQEIARRYRVYAAQQEFRISVLISIVLFVLSCIVFFFSVQFATESASNSVTDIILSNTPAFDVDVYFVYGAAALAAFILFLCLTHPKRIPFTLNSLTLLIVIRSVFTSLTHIGPFPIQASSDFGATTTKLFFGGDLFFSNHTAIPFMMALIFWQQKHLRYIFLAWSIFFGTIALMGHLHYTIDVFSAFFITYSVYHLSQWIFPKDLALLHSEH